MGVCVLVDYGAGNLHSAEKALARVASDHRVCVSGQPEDIAAADHIVLPGDGAFPACRAALAEKPGLEDALRDAVERQGRPLLGICVGMQLLATRGFEFAETPGLGWIDGEIHPLRSGLKVPHMGWNDLVMDRAHPVTDGMSTGDHAYFVHSFGMVMDRPEERVAHVDYDGDVTAIVAKDTVVGAQFHPEKSQAAGLRLLENFLGWRP